MTRSYRETSSYTMLYETRNYDLSLYEPASGCYLGAYVLSNKYISFDTGVFETLTEKKHAVSMYNMAVSDSFPETWAVSMIASMKTPLISVRPDNEYDMFDEWAISELAKGFGEFYVPVFIEFYPDPGKLNMNPEKYLSFYHRAREIFREKASNVAFVWSVGLDNVLDCQKYYPGDDYVDWVGLHIYRPWEGDGYGEDLFDRFDFFYYSFQGKNPIMISRLAVSHYTSADHVYRNHEASIELNDIYSRIKNSYPRVKLVNYMDFSSLSLGRDSGDNFSVTDTDRVLAAYKYAVSPEHFLSELDMYSLGENVNQWMRSPFQVLKRENEYYISENSCQYDLGIQGLKNPVVIDGVNYYSMNKLSLNRSIEADDENGILRLGLR